MVTPTVASIPTAAMPMPYSPAVLYETQIVPQISSTGSTADRMPTARPAMMFVAGPVREASAILRIGPAAV